MPTRASTRQFAVPKQTQKFFLHFHAFHLVHPNIWKILKLSLTLFIVHFSFQFQNIKSRDLLSKVVKLSIPDFTIQKTMYHKTYTPDSNPEWIISVFLKALEMQEEIPKHTSRSSKWKLRYLHTCSGKYKSNVSKRRSWYNVIISETTLK